MTPFRMASGCIRLGAAILVALGLMLQGVARAPVAAETGAEAILALASLCGAGPDQGKAPHSRHDHAKCVVCSHVSGALVWAPPAVVPVPRVIAPARSRIASSTIGLIQARLAYASRAPPPIG